MTGYLHVNPINVTESNGSIIVAPEVMIQYPEGSPEFNYILSLVGSYNYYLSPTVTIPDTVATVDVNIYDASSNKTGEGHSAGGVSAYIYGWPPGHPNYMGPNSCVAWVFISTPTVTVPASSTHCAIHVLLTGNLNFTGEITPSISVTGPPPPSQVTCPYCGMTFNTEAELNEHIITVHPPPEEYYTLTLLATPQTVQQGTAITLQATLNENGTPLSNEGLRILYKNPTDANFTPLTSIVSASTYEQYVDPSWFRESTCQIKAVYPADAPETGIASLAESNIITLTLVAVTMEIRWQDTSNYFLAPEGYDIDYVTNAQGVAYTFMTQDAYTLDDRVVGFRWKFNNGVIRDALPPVEGYYYEWARYPHYPWGAAGDKFGVQANRYTNSGDYVESLWVYAPVHLAPEPVSITLTVAAGPNGVVTPAGAQSLTVGLTYQFQATPDSECALDHWDLNGDSKGSSNPLSFVATADMDAKTLTALFTVIPPPKATVTIAVSGNGITDLVGSQQFNVGETVTITAIPETGSTFENWALNGSMFTANPLSLFVTADMNGQTLTANFVTTPPKHVLTHTRIYSLVHSLSRVSSRWSFPLIDAYDRAMAKLT